jgi:hypothetical protein
LNLRPPGPELRGEEPILLVFNHLSGASTVSVLLESYQFGMIAPVGNARRSAFVSRIVHAARVHMRENTTEGVQSFTKPFQSFLAALKSGHRGTYIHAYPSAQTPKTIDIIVFCFFISHDEEPL